MGNKVDYSGELTLSVSVSDLDAGIAWYESVLGFNLLYRIDDLGWCELSTGVPRVNVGLGVVEDIKPGGTTPTFGVADIEAARANLEAHNVKLDGDIVTIPDMVKLQTFYDPDGNPLMFAQDLSGGQMG